MGFFFSQIKLTYDRMSNKFKYYTQYGLVDRTTYTTRNHHLVTFNEGKDPHFNCSIGDQSFSMSCLVWCFVYVGVLVLEPFKLTFIKIILSIYSINIILDYRNLLSQIKDSLTFYFVIGLHLRMEMRAKKLYTCI